MSADTLWHDAINSISIDGTEQDSRVGKTKELIGFSGVADPTSPFLWSSIRSASPIYAAGELLWYVSGSDSGYQITHYAPSYARFLTTRGKAEGAYGPRIFGGNVLQDVCEELLTHNESRRAVVPIFALHDLRNTKRDCKDIPCTLSLQFFVRNSELHLVTTMRSNDAWLGLPYDSFCFMMIQIMVAEFIGVSLGTYYHQAGSMHLYEKDIAKLRKGPQRYVADSNSNRPLLFNGCNGDPTIVRRFGIAKDECEVRAGKFIDREEAFANNYGPFTVPTTLLTLASLQNYKQVDSSDEDRLAEFVDQRLIERAAQVVNKRGAIQTSS